MGAKIWRRFILRLNGMDDRNKFAMNRIGIVPMGCV